MYTNNFFLNINRYYHISVDFLAQVFFPARYPGTLPKEMVIVSCITLLVNFERYGKGCVLIVQ